MAQSKNLNIMFLSFGDNLNYHSQLNLALISAYKFSSANTRFVIYTDYPEYYLWAKEKVIVKKIDPDLMKDWKGPHNFFWRTKIMAMLDCAKEFDGHLLYLDSDVIVLSNLTEMISKLELGYSFMHLQESKLSEDKAAHKKQMWSQIAGKEYVGVKINPDIYMWNAGVVCLSEQNKVSYLEKALRINDKMLDEKVVDWLIEQFSLSVSLNSESKLLPAEKEILHYWGNKDEWNQKINNYLSNAFQKAKTLESLANEFDLKYWSSIPYSRTKRSMNKRVSKFLLKYFPDHTKQL